METYSLTEDNEFLKRASFVNGFPDYVAQNTSTGFSSALNSENEKGYLDITTTKRFIYALYSGKTFNTNDIESTVRSSEIQVFDWNCNPVKKIILNKEVFNISVSENDDKIYGMVHDPEPRVVLVQL